MEGQRDDRAGQPRIALQPRQQAVGGRAARAPLRGEQLDHHRPLPCGLPGLRGHVARAAVPIAATASAIAIAAIASATNPKSLRCTFDRTISASSAARRRPLAFDYTAGSARRLDRRA